MAKSKVVHKLIPEEQREMIELRTSFNTAEEYAELDFDQEFWLKVKDKVDIGLSWHKAMDERRAERLMEDARIDPLFRMIYWWPKLKKYQQKSKFNHSLEYLISRLTEIILEKDEEEKYEAFFVEDFDTKPSLLHLAAEQNFRHVSRCLVERYPTLLYQKATDKLGSLPVELALRKRNDDSAAYLISQMQYDRVEDLFLSVDNIKTSKFYFGNIISGDNAGSNENNMKNFDSCVVQFTLSSPINPPMLMELNVESGKTTNLSQNSSKEQKYLANEHLCRTKLTAVSKDGTKVPITLFHKKSIELNSQHPVLTHVYGSYGMNVNRDFSPEKFQLLTEGWILAYCHVRGGGELGRKWYHMGRRKNKIKTFEDFEACIKAISEQGYSSPHLTALMGTSAGGLPVAALCNAAPHLVKAAVLKVPFVDLMTSMLDDGLPLTAQEYEEFGNPRLDLQDFNNLKSICPYVNISKQHYPSLLFMSSVNDVRVPYWMSLKYVSKLRHLNRAKDFSNPQNMILLKTDFEIGHFGSGTFEEAAFIHAFLYKSLGLPLG